MSVTVTIPSLPQSAVAGSVYVVDPTTIATFNVQAGKRYVLDLHAHTETEGSAGSSFGIRFGGSATWHPSGRAHANVYERFGGSNADVPSPMYGLSASVDRSAQRFFAHDASNVPFNNARSTAYAVFDVWTDGTIELNVYRHLGYGSQVNVYQFIATLTEVEATDFTPEPPPNPNAD